MDPTHDYTLPTLISVWSAMLGGAIGGAAGKLSSHAIYNGALGLALGATASVLVYVVLSGLMYVIVQTIFQAELGEYTLGHYQGDTLASLLGGAAGCCGAIIVTMALPSQRLTTPHAFAVCWSAAAIVPVLLSLALWWRWRGRRR